MSNPSTNDNNNTSKQFYDLLLPIFNQKGLDRTQLTIKCDELVEPIDYASKKFLIKQLEEFREYLVLQGVLVENLKEFDKELLVYKETCTITQYFEKDEKLQQTIIDTYARINANEEGLFNIPQKLNYEQLKKLSRGVFKKTGSMQFYISSESYVKGRIVNEIFENSKDTPLAHVCVKKGKDGVETQFFLFGECFNKKVWSVVREVSLPLFYYKFLSEGNKEIMLVTSVKQETGNCEIKGVITSVDDYANITDSKKVLTKLPVFFAKSVENSLEVFEDHETFFDMVKNNGITRKSFFNYLFSFTKFNDESGVEEFVYGSYPVWFKWLMWAWVLHANKGDSNKYPFHILMLGPSGCLTDDTKIMMPRDLSKYPDGVPMKDLLGKGPIKVYSFNTKTKKLEIKQSDGVHFSKIADVYEIELTNGIKIKATEDHPFMLIDGTYKKLKDLVWSKNSHKERLYDYHKEGKTYYKKTDRLRFVNPKPSTDNYLKFDYVPLNKEKRKTGMVEHRFVASQVFENFDKSLIVHHKDGNHKNNCVNNLELLTQSEHINIHMKPYFFKKGNKFCENTGYSTKKKKRIKVGSKEFCEQTSKLVKKWYENKENYATAIKRLKNHTNNNYYKFGGIIKNIKHIGARKVYDVVNVVDNHNFIANGLVVSNTGKSHIGNVIHGKVSEGVNPWSGEVSTMKDLIPSFKGTFPKRGYLADCTRFCFLDEFLRVLVSKGGGEFYNIEEGLACMNSLLEHQKRRFGSGNGSVIVNMSARVFATTNPVRGVKNVSCMVDKYDHSFLNRWLVFWQPDDFVKLVNNNKGVFFKQELNVDNETFLSIVDYCQSFHCRFGVERLFKIVDSVKPMLSGDMLDLYNARGRHHAKCLFDGIIKTRCLFEKDKGFHGKDEDFELFSLVWKKMFSTWIPNLASLKSVDVGQRIHFLPENCQYLLSYLFEHEGVSSLMLKGDVDLAYNDLIVAFEILKNNGLVFENDNFVFTYRGMKK